MIGQIKDIIIKLSPELWLYACLGLMAVIFLVGLILSFVTGQAPKFKKGVKNFLKNPTPKNATATAADMPAKIKKLYKRARATGEKPSDVISYDACVTWTYSTSFAARFVKAVIFSSVLIIILCYFATTLSALAGEFDSTNLDDLANRTYSVYVSPAVLSVLALILTLLAGIISRSIYNGLAKTYNEYVDKLDSISKGGNNYDDIKTQELSEQMPVYNEPVQTDNGPEIHDDRFRTFETPTRLNIETVEEVSIEEEKEVSDGVVTTTTTTITTSKPVLNEIEEEIKREKEARLEAEKAAAERAAAIERARAQAEERRKAAAAAQSSGTVFSTPVTPTPQQTVYSTPVTPQQPIKPTPVETAAPSGSSSADEVIAKIEKINNEGASLATMKEVAMQLQQERAKPENKTPEQQKKLNEALSSLLKAMSAATKR